MIAEPLFRSEVAPDDKNRETAECGPDDESRDVFMGREPPLAARPGQAVHRELEVLRQL